MIQGVSIRCTHLYFSIEYLTADANDKHIVLWQQDMLAYRKPGEPIQTAFPARYHTPELSSLLRNITELYVPETVVGVTGACCSDHQVRPDLFA